MAKIEWQKNLILAAVATLGAALVDKIAGKYVGDLMAGTDFLGVTVGAYITVAAALIIYNTWIAR